MQAVGSEAFREMRKSFLDLEVHEIDDFWIDHKFKFSRGNVELTRKRLESDAKDCELIQQLHDLRKSKKLDNEESVKVEAKINELVTKKNIPLCTIKHVDAELLVFDLHGCTSNKVIEYVDKIIAEMKKRSESKQRDPVTLITGHGQSVYGKEPVIKGKLLKEYGDQIQRDENNEGRLIFKLRN